MKELLEEYISINIESLTIIEHLLKLLVDANLLTQEYETYNISKKLESALTNVIITYLFIEGIEHEQDY